MPNSIFGIFFVLLIIGSAVLLGLGYGIHLFTISGIVSGTFGAKLETYTHVDLGLSIRHPEDFTVNPNYVYGLLGRGQQIAGISFTVPYAKATGTNLSPDTYLSVEYLPNQPSCSAGLFLPEAKGTQGITEFGESYTFATHVEQAAGNTYEEMVYALPNASPCVAVRYFIHSTNIGNYEANTVTAYDRANLLSVFDTMRRSLAAKH